MKSNFRHGDVIIISAEIPSESKQCDSERDVILAHGEVTGHAHRIASGAQLLKYNEKTYLRVIGPFAMLTHEEHHALKIPQGDYEIKIQEDYSPKGWKKVQD